MKKEIFDSLARLSSNSPANSNSPTQSPAVEISGELAFCLETLMNTVGKHMNLSPNSVLEKILDAGIQQWVEQLPEKTKKSVGLSPRTAEPATTSRSKNEVDDTDDPDPAHAQQAAYAQMTENYGYTPLTAHSVGKGNGRKEQRSSSNGGRNGGKSKNVRNAGKKHPPKRGGSRRRKFAAPKSHSSAQ